MQGILGRKIGMTNAFDEAGKVLPVTLLEAGPCVVIGTKAKEKDGYSAIVLGYEEKKASKVKRPEKNFFGKLKISPKKKIKEIRVESAAGVKIGDKIAVSMFKNGDYVDITGTTIGKGFQGGMKRWNWSGGGSGHGSMFHRAPGSIGASSFPSRVHKGKTMPGRMGGVKNTIQNLKVVAVEEEKNLLAVKGGVPGHRGGLLIVRHAKKKPPKEVKHDESKNGQAGK
jgi:large subunit ribosomal protein L3